MTSSRVMGPPPTAARPAAGREPRRPPGPRRQALLGVLRALPWIGPALLLVAGVVGYPAFDTFRASLQDISITGAVRGLAGLANYRSVLTQPDLPQVLLTTVVWVVASVLLTTLIALPVAQLLNTSFPGRRLVRAAVIVPWASSAVMTAIGFRWIFNYYYGLLNPLLQGIGIIGGPVDWLGDDRTGRWAMIAAVTFISVPFTVFTVVAGLSGIPDELAEAARVDGAGAWQRYRHITLPLLRPALSTATVLNTVWILNSFPVIYVLNKSNPGYANDTLVTFMYKLSFITDHDIGAGAALSILNALVVGALAAIFISRTRIEVDQ